MEIKDIVAGKKYTNKAGEEKTRWVTIGSLFIKDDGKMTVKMNEYINPLAFQNDKGEVWFNVFEHKEQNREKKEEPEPAAEPVPVAEPVRGEEVKVIQDAQAYAEKWRKEAESKKAMAEAPNEEYFQNVGTILDDIPF